MPDKERTVCPNCGGKGHVKTLAPERRYDLYGGMRLMAEAEGYVMMRRVGRMPCLITRKEWDALSCVPLDGPKLRVVQNMQSDRAETTDPEPVEINQPFERVPQCACDRGSGPPPTRLQQLECKMCGGPCSPNFVYGDPREGTDR